MDWILADKSGEGELADDFQDLMIRTNQRSVSSGRIGTLDSLAASDNVTVLADTDASIEAQIRQGDNRIDEGLARLQEIYGAEHLKSLSDSELYSLFKRHALAK
jgi:ApbE superfamily uncharacterized protein (UPF0280 family)